MGGIRELNAAACCCGACAGIYPFAGKEVARAFALISTELSDCNDDLEGLGVLEMQNLQEWESK
jgi:membrane-associated progesterone receptor component